MTDAEVTMTETLQPRYELCQETDGTGTVCDTWVKPPREGRFLIDATQDKAEELTRRMNALQPSPSFSNP